VRRVLISAAVSVVALVATAASPLVTAVGAAAPVRYRDPVFSSVDLTSDLVYGHAVDQNGVRQTLTFDLYTPHGDTLKSRPVIVWVHGGGFSGGDKTSVELVDEANEFTMKGYVNISINYRLAPEGCVGDPGEPCFEGIIEAMQDGQSAVRYLRAKAKKYGIDPTRIAMGGSSAGAITALNVGYNASDPGPGRHQDFSSAVEAVQSLSGAAIFTNPGPDGAPAILFHGTADPIVPYSWAQATVESAQEAGDIAILHSFEGDGHVPYLAHRTQILNQTRNFFYKHLDLADAPT
jgi:acetyl esterase/lipase